jgi:hypothetical protein
VDRSYFILPNWANFSGYAPAAHQVDDQHDQGNNQQKVNQASGDVQAEAEKPENQEHHENCPKHCYLLRSFERSENVRRENGYLVPAGAKAFPHSRQDVLDRGVINPQ